MASSFDTNIGAWARTVMLGLGLGAAWYTIKGDIALLAKDIDTLTGQHGRIAVIEGTIEDHEARLRAMAADRTGLRSPRPGDGDL